MLLYVWIQVGLIFSIFFYSLFIKIEKKIPFYIAFNTYCGRAVINEKEIQNISIFINLFLFVFFNFFFYLPLATTQCMENNADIHMSSGSSGEEREDLFAEIIGLLQRNLDIHLNSNEQQYFFTSFHLGAPYTAINIENMPNILQTTLSEFEVSENMLVQSLNIIKPSELFREEGVEFTSQQYLDIFNDIFFSIQHKMFITSAVFVKVGPTYLNNFISFYSFQNIHNLFLNVIREQVNLPTEVYVNIVFYLMDPFFSEFVNKTSFYYNILLNYNNMINTNVETLNLINNLEDNDFITVQDENDGFLRFEINREAVENYSSTNRFRINHITPLIEMHRNYLNETINNRGSLYTHAIIPSEQSLNSKHLNLILQRGGQ